MHPVAAASLLAEASGGSNDDIKIALISAIAVVIAAVIPALLSLRERVPREVASLQKQRDDQETEFDELDRKYHELREFVWQLGYNPDTHQHEEGPT